MKHAGSLKFGYSTGACAATVIAAAWKSLTHPKQEIPSHFPVMFPDGKTRTITLHQSSEGYAELIKDAGNDPDCTHRALIYAKVRLAETNELQTNDYLLEIANAKIILRADSGIGLCLRPGLDCELNKWAINKTPRTMIAENLKYHGMTKGCYLVLLGVKDGEEIAKKTLNARLGVIGGISILGTTGIVRPFSHEAYIATIRISAKSAALQNINTLVFCTGHRTLKTAQHYLDHLQPESFICIADFIADSLRAAQDQSMKKSYVACMPGKLCKYALGFEYTHAHQTDQNIHFLSDIIRRHYKLSIKSLTQLLDCASVRQAMEFVPEQYHLAIFSDLAEIALEHFKRFAPHTEHHLIICHFDGALMFQYPPPSTSSND